MFGEGKERVTRIPKWIPLSLSPFSASAGKKRPFSLFSIGQEEEDQLKEASEKFFPPLLDRKREFRERSSLPSRPRVKRQSIPLSILSFVALRWKGILIPQSSIEVSFPPLCAGIIIFPSPDMCVGREADPSFLSPIPNRTRDLWPRQRRPRHLSSPCVDHSIPRFVDSSSRTQKSEARAAVASASAVAASLKNCFSLPSSPLPTHPNFPPFCFLRSEREGGRTREKKEEGWRGKEGNPSLCLCNLLLFGGRRGGGGALVYNLFRANDSFLSLFLSLFSRRHLCLSLF